MNRFTDRTKCIIFNRVQEECRKEVKKNGKKAESKEERKVGRKDDLNK